MTTDDGLSNRRQIERRETSDRRAANRRRRRTDATELVTVTDEEVVQARLNPPIPMPDPMPDPPKPPRRWWWPWNRVIEP